MRGFVQLDILKNKIFLQYIQMFLLALILPIIIGCTALVATLWDSRQHMIENDYAMLEQVQKGLTREFDRIQHMVVGIAIDDDLNNYESNNEPENLLEFTELASKVKIDEQNKDFLISLYVYVASEGYIICDGAKYDIPLFYNAVIKRSGESYDSWCERMSAEHHNDYLFTDNTTFYDGGVQKRSIEYIQSYPTERNADVKGNIVAVINYDKMTEYYGNIYKKNNALYVLNKKNDIIYSVGSERHPLRSEYISMEQERLTDFASSEIVFKKEDSKYKFIAISDGSVANLGLKGIIIFDIVCITLFIAVGVIAGIMSVYRMSKPVIEITSMVNGFNPNNDDTSGVDELNKKLAAIIEQSKGAVLKQRNMIKNNLLKRLIRENLSEEENIREELEEVDISFSKPDFVVIVINIRSDKPYDSKTIACIKYAITQIATEIFARYGSIEMIDDDWQEIALILNLRNEDDLDNKLIRELTYLDKIISYEFDVEMEINIGNVCSDVCLLHQSYCEAKECAEYRIYSGTRRVLAYSKLKNKENGYLYNAEIENEFIRNVIMGNENLALNCLENMLSSHKDSSAIVMKCLFFNLLGTMLKILNSSNIEIAENIDRNFHLEELFECKNMIELQTVIKRIVQELCRDINLHSNDKKQKLRIVMIEYIQNNFCDNSMSLEKVADEFNLNITYISHFFKEQFGENFSDYVTRLRVEKAKELMLDPELTLGEIAVRVGYANSTVFIKNFKKIENITPGKYRESNSK